MQGHIDLIERDKLVGWVVSDQENDNRLVEALVENRCIGASLNNIFRTDLREAGVSDGTGGFAVRLTAPLSEPQLEQIRLRFNGEERLLREFCSESTSYRWAVTSNLANHLVFFPDYSATNPYQRCLYESARKSGWSVEGSSLMSAIEKQRELGKSVIFHLHWTAPILGGATTDAEAESYATAYLSLLHRFISEGGRFIWTIHNVLPHDLKFEKHELQMRRKLARFAHRILVHGYSDIEKTLDLLNTSRSKFRVIRHGSYIGQYPDTVTQEAARTYLGLPSDDLVFLFQGQLRPYKGIEELVGAFHNQLMKHPSSHLVIAGKPVHPMRVGDVAEMVADIPNVTVIERFIPDHELHIYYRASDFVVAPYRNILTSGSIFNAMSFCCPLIAPKIGSIPEIVENEVNGLLYDPQDPTGLIDLLDKAASMDAQQIKHMGQAALTSMELIDWSSIGEKLVETIRQEDIWEEMELELESEHRIRCAVRLMFEHETKRDSVAIVILNYGNLDDTIELVSSLRKSNHAAFDIIVVDNASPDLSPLELVAALPDVSLILSPMNLGYAGGNNLALSLLRQYKYDYVWILNPDTIVDRHCIDELITVAGSEAELGVLGCLITLTHAPDRVWFAGADLYTNPGLQTSHRYSGAPISSVPKTPFESDYITGASMFFRATLIDEVGLIPEQYFLYFEETDWCQKVRAAGKKLLVVPAATMKHKKNSESQNLATPIYLYYYVRSAILFSTKYLPQSIDKSIQLLKNTFIQPWLIKIRERNAGYAELAQKIVELAIEHGKIGLKGPFALSEWMQSASARQETVGHLDACETSLIGWAFSKKLDGHRPVVELLIDGNPVASVKANQPRIDLIENGYGDGQCGFSVAIPNRFRDGELHEVRGLIDGSIELIGSPVVGRWSRRKSRHIARIEGIDPRGVLVGWAWDQSFPEKFLELEVLAEGQIVNVVTADRFRQDLQDAGIGCGKHAFESALPLSLEEGNPHIFEVRHRGSAQVLAKRKVNGFTTVQLPKVKSLNEFLHWSYLYVEARVKPVAALTALNSWLADYKIASLAQAKNRVLTQKISVIMPVHDREKSVAQAIASVASQSNQNYELIIVDDGSQDHSVRVIKQAIAHHCIEDRVQLIELDTNLGVSAARNHALRAASGEIIAYLDSDNRWDSDYLLLMANAFAENPETETAYAGQEIWQVRTLPNGRRVEELRSIRLCPFNRSLLENRNFIDLNVFAHHRRIFNEQGGFNEGMSRLVDWELILRYTRRRAPAFVPLCLCHYFIDRVSNQITHTVSFSQNHQLLEKTVNELGQSSASVENQDVDVVIVADGGQDSLIRCYRRVCSDLEGLEASRIVLIADDSLPDPNKLIELAKSSLKTLFYSSVTLVDALIDAVVGMSAEQNNRPLIVMSSSALPNVGTIHRTADMLVGSRNLGLVTGRRTVRGTIDGFNGVRGYATGPLAVDLMPGLIHSKIVEINSNSDHEMTRVLSIPFFYCGFSPEARSWLSSSNSEADLESWIMRTTDLLRTRGFTVAYTPKLAVTDQSV